MADLKRCRQCGILKDVDDFRKYTYSKANDTEGRFSICKSCESINTRLTKLQKNIEDAQQDMFTTDMQKFDSWCKERDAILRLYSTLENRGLYTPRVKKPQVDSAPASSLQVNKLLEFYDEKPTARVCEYAQPTDNELPVELTRWLAGTPEEWEEAGMSPEYLQETIYESLKAKYRPQIGVDPNTFLPTYNNTFRDTLNDILRLFDNYEELMAGKAEEEEMSDGTESF